MYKSGTEPLLEGGLHIRNLLSDTQGTAKNAVFQIMDLLLVKVGTVLGIIFPWLFLGCVVSAIILIIRAQRGPRQKARAIEIGTGIGILGGCYLLFFLAGGFLSHFATKSIWEGMLEWKPNRMVITSASGNERREIEDAGVINQFVSIIVKSDKVWAHRSHPVAELTLFFPQNGRTYSLGRDSEKPHEFWGPIGQFRSLELEDWLEKYAPRPQKGQAPIPAPVTNLAGRKRFVAESARKGISP